MYMICYCVGKMNTPDNFKNHIYERRTKLREQLFNNSVYKRIKKLAKKNEKPKERGTDIVTQFVYDYWDWRIEILGDHKLDFVNPGECLSMLKYVERTETTVVTNTYIIEKGWLVNDALFCQPACWSYFLGISAKTRLESASEAKKKSHARRFMVIPEKTKKLVDIMISLNHIYLDLGVGKLRNPEYGILSSDKDWNYSVKGTKWVKDCQKLKM